jgi:hypothetical protein
MNNKCAELLSLETAENKLCFATSVNAKLRVDLSARLEANVGLGIWKFVARKCHTQLGKILTHCQQLWPFSTVPLLTMTSKGTAVIKQTSCSVECGIYAV